MLRKLSVVLTITNWHLSWQHILVVLLTATIQWNYSILSCDSKNGIINLWYVLSVLISKFLWQSILLTFVFRFPLFICLSFDGSWTTWGFRFVLRKVCIYSCFPSLRVKQRLQKIFLQLHDIRENKKKEIILQLHYHNVSEKIKWIIILLHYIQKQYIILQLLYIWENKIDNFTITLNQRK